MREIRLHGRGGQGVVIAAEILATAFVKEGKFACSFPLFGVERRGAPLISFVRFGSAHIRERTRVYTPDYVLVLDPAIKNSPQTVEGLKQEGTVIINSGKKQPPVHLLTCAKKIAIINATRIGLDMIGSPITNSCMLGAFAAVTRELKLDSILSAFSEYFNGSILEKNRLCAIKGFEEVTILENVMGKGAVI